jgi:phospholipid-binding lipoprotein MlaA
LHPWNGVVTSRLHVIGVFALAIVLSGCGTMSRALDSASSDGSVVGARAASRAPVETIPLATRQAVENWVAVESGAAVDVALGAVSAPLANEDVETAAFDAAEGNAAPLVLAQAKGGVKRGEDEYDVEEYDPWESFNERMFEVNRKLDKYVLKPVAKAYDKVLPDEIQRMIGNAFDNVGSFPRFFNSLFQAKWDGAVREASRFLLNTTVGVGGLFDMAKAAEIQKSREDFGQTLCWYGMPPGAYINLPFLPPLTVREGIGMFVDGFFDPLYYLLPFIWERLFLKIEDTVNDRSLNLELYQGFEETVIDMYSAVRHAYLERRRNLCKE